MIEPVKSCKESSRWISISQCMTGMSFRISSQPISLPAVARTSLQRNDHEPPAGVYPIEIYSDARVAEFMEEDRMTPKERERLEKKLKGS